MATGYWDSKLSPWNEIFITTSLQSLVKVVQCVVSLVDTSVPQQHQSKAFTTVTCKYLFSLLTLFMQEDEISLAAGHPCRLCFTDKQLSINKLNWKQLNFQGDMACALKDTRMVWPSFFYAHVLHVIILFLFLWYDFFFCITIKYIHWACYWALITVQNWE